MPGSKKQDALLIIPCLCLAVGIGVFAYLGTFSRYWADDYCYSAMVVEGGLWGALINFPQTIITSRYSAFLVMALSESLGVTTVRYLPLVMIAMLVAGLAWLVDRIFRKINIQIPQITGVFLAESAVFFTLLVTPNRFQSVYWRAANVIYLGSLVMGVLTTILLIMMSPAENLQKKKPYHWMLVWGVCVLAGGFSETLTVVMVGGLLILILVSCLNIWQIGRIRKEMIILFGTGAAGYGVALLFLFLSPTNTYRQELLTTSMNPALQIFRSFQFSIDFIVETVKGLPVPLGILLFGVLVVMYRQFPAPIDQFLKNRLTRILWLGPLAGLLLIFFSFAPSVYGQSAFPEGRTLIIGRFIIVLAILTWGTAAGWLLRNILEKFTDNKVKFQVRRPLYEKIVWIMAIIILAAYPLRAAWETFGSVPEYRQRAEEWDARDIKIRYLAAIGERNIVVKAMDNLYDVYELSPEADLWVNRCAARYYQVETIKAVP